MDSFGRLKAINFGATQVRARVYVQRSLLWGSTWARSTGLVPYPRPHSCVRNSASLGAAGLVRVPRLGQSDTTFFLSFSHVTGPTALKPSSPRPQPRSSARDAPDPPPSITLYLGRGPIPARFQAGNKGGEKGCQVGRTPRVDLSPR